MTNEIILVDECDREIGVCEKLHAHKIGALHRAISVFIFSSEGKILLQKRAQGKYHSGGLWSNTCCSHPMPGESVDAAAHRRLKEEMGFDCPLSEVYSFVYRTEFDNGLIEHEYDHVLTGVFDGDPDMNPEEAEDYKWEAPAAVLRDIREHPEIFSYWFAISFGAILSRVSAAKK